MENPAYFLESGSASKSKKTGLAGKTHIVPSKDEDIGFGFPLYIPKSLHSRLAAQARDEGGSVNTLVVELLSEGLMLRRSRMFK